MAIIIPSSKTYDRQNSKVRDNVIERIEVGAVEIVPNNEYETPVYNEKFLGGINPSEDIANGLPDMPPKDIIGSQQSDTNILVAGSAIRTYCEYSTINLTIKKNPEKENKLISKIFKSSGEIKYSLLGVNQTIKEYYANKIFRTAYYNDTSGSIQSIYQFMWGEKDNENTLYSTSNSTINGFGYGNDVNVDVLLYNISGYEGVATIKQVEKQYDKLPNIDKNILTNPINLSLQTSGYNYNIQGSEEFSLQIPTDNLYQLNDGNYTVIETDDAYIVQNIKILTKLTYYVMSSGATFAATPTQYVEYKYWGGRCLKIIQKAEQVTLTIYGNTIGIDLTDKTVYINGETQKKVHRIDGNELMQTSNYVVTGSNSVPAIEKLYAETQAQYANGKETATIRCSISDYFENDGTKAISIDNSTGKMSFKLYDQVIPMVYGADGQDRPMSTYKDGSAKVFQVLGSKIFYDGAVWQELSLQEVDKTKIL